MHTNTSSAITRINLVVANVYIVQGEKTILVDTGAESSAGWILRALKQHHISPEELSMIVLTHAHVDHAGSARRLREQLRVPVAVHEADAQMLKRGDNGTLQTLGAEAVIVKFVMDHPFPSLDADILLDSSTDLRRWGVDARLLHTPGHTSGSISLLFTNGDAIVGDVLRGGIMGGTFLASRPNYPYFLPHQNDKRTLLHSVQKLLDAGVERFFVGHGGPLSRVDVQRWLSLQK
jgi:glyoxylase-like metal-dependent hydrolase (beta-lactamase superfamily II)